MVEPAFTGLIGRDLGESVVAAFLAHTQLQRPQISAERPRARGMSAPLHPDFGKEFIRDPEHIDRRQLGSEKMTHMDQLPGSLAGRTV